MRSANPALNAAAFSSAPRVIGEEAMTLSGAVNSTFILLGLVILGATWTWNLAFAGQPTLLYTAGGAIGAFIAVLVAAFKKEWSPVLAPVYAILEGLFLGSVSARFEGMYSGIVIQAVGLTLTTTFGLLLVYRSGLIKATENFRLGIVAATFGIAAFYIIAIVLSFFGIQAPLIWDNGWMGIAFSGFVVTIAALNLVLDFDFIESAAEQGVPKYMEWYAALGLMVTLVWLYIEFLRLLAKLSSRR